MSIPKIGSTIDNRLAIDLCKGYGFDEIVTRIERQPEQFKEWKFDGASMLPDGLAARVVGMDQETFSEPALKHDLKYAYGIPGDGAAKDRADKEFKQDLLDINVDSKIASMMFSAVAHGGNERWKLSFSWGFARI